MGNLLNLEEEESCVVRETGVEALCLEVRGTHRATARPDVLAMLFVMLRLGTDPAGAVLINLKI